MPELHTDDWDDLARTVLEHIGWIADGPVRVEELLGPIDVTAGRGGVCISLGDVLYRVSVEIDGERHGATAPTQYEAACELARLVGIELSDG